MRFRQHYYLAESYLTEGGGYGHLTHPFEDDELSFSDMKKMVGSALTGKLKTTQEKTDGQNLLITVKDGSLKAARNIGELKGHGAKAMDIDAVMKKFEGRGEIQKAFVFAMKDLGNAIKGLTPDDVNDIFQNGKKFLSVEIMTPKTENVIPYGFDMIIPHGLIEYDENGKAIGEDKERAKELFELIQKANLDTQERFKLTPPHDIKELVADDAKKQSKAIGSALDKLISKYELGNDDTLLEYKKAYWKEFIANKVEEAGTELPEDIEEALINRWAGGDKSFSIGKIKKKIDDEQFKNWIVDFEKNGLRKEQKKSVRPFEILFLKLGATLLSKMTKFLAVNPDKSLNTLKTNLEKKIAEIQDLNDPDAVEKLNTELERLKDIGGLEAIVPSEGITFVYNGKVYKLTGTFAPINQILGIGRYNK